jgi:hypothetical protein
MTLLNRAVEDANKNLSVNKRAGVRLQQSA